MQKVDVSDALRALQEGDVVVYPTDTLYALGADIYDERAIRRVFELKHRPFAVPLPVAVSDVGQMGNIAVVDARVQQLASCFLPGPLTLILEKKEVPNVVTSGLEKVAVRIPDNEVALELLSSFGPLTATSANIHGKKTPSFIKDIMIQFPVDCVKVYLDYGKLAGSPSTIVDLTYETPTIVREGRITKREILDAI